MQIIHYNVVREKWTPYGRIDIYGDGESVEFVLTADVFVLANRYARRNNWTEDDIKTIGATYPF